MCVRVCVCVCVIHVNIVARTKERNSDTLRGKFTDGKHSLKVGVRMCWVFPMRQANLQLYPTVERCLASKGKQNPIWTLALYYLSTRV